MTANTAEQRTNTFFFRVMESAPPGLLISAAIGLCIVGVFQYIFYLHVLPAHWHTYLLHTLSVAIALFFEALGFYFLVATVRDFSGGHRREGYIGLLATSLLWGYAIWEAHHISASFDAGGKYWAIMGIIGTIVCIVRVVELRITLTVTSAFAQQNIVGEQEKQIAHYQKQLAETTGRLNTIESEAKAAHDRQQAEAERLRQLEAEEAERQKEAKSLAIQQENETLRRQLARLEKKESENNSALTGKQKLNRETALRIMRAFYQKNSVAPTRVQLAQLAGVDERTVGNCFPNGAWAEAITLLKQEAPQEAVAGN